jgi:hypothetical protein
LNPPPNYRVQRDCLAALPDAKPQTLIVLVTTAWLAGVLARELDDGAILGAARPMWERYADELEVAIRLASSDMLSSAITARLAECVRAIYPPGG